MVVLLRMMWVALVVVDIRHRHWQVAVVIQVGVMRQLGLMGLLGLVRALAAHLQTPLPLGSLNFHWLQQVGLMKMKPLKDVID